MHVGTQMAAATSLAILLTPPDEAAAATERVGTPCTLYPAPGGRGGLPTELPVDCEVS